MICGRNLDRVISWPSLGEYSRALGQKRTDYWAEVPKIEEDGIKKAVENC